MSKLPEYYPNVHLILEPTKNLVGKFIGDDPSGATIHYTASRNLEATHKTLMDRGLNYHFIIDREGKVIQTAQLTHRVHHAGKAKWLDKSPNRSHVSVALLSWGLLNDGKTWVGKRLPVEETAHRRNNTWDKATMAQEEALLHLCRWLVCMGIPPAGVCGHDECCLPKGRKVDPGGVLSWTMPEFRRLVTSAMT